MRFAATSIIALLSLSLGLTTAEAQVANQYQPTAYVAPANQAPMAPKPAKLPKYVSVDLIDMATTLPPPPADGSIKQLKDLEKAKAIMAAASPERMARAAWDDKHESVELFSTVIEGLDVEKLPKTKAFFEQIETDENYFANIAKLHFLRQRPYEYDHTIQTCVPSVWGKSARSYPSGHATLGYTTGIILAHLIPEKAETILNRAHDYAESRVVCGVHYPDDAVASQALGSIVAIQMLQNPQFMADFADVKAELKAAGLTK